MTDYQQNTPPISETVNSVLGLFGILSGYNHELFYSNFLKFIYQTDKEYFINVLVRLFGGNELTKNFFNDCELRREYRHLDLSFVTKNVTSNGKEKEEVVLIIENKLKSLPEKKQLDQYVKSNPRAKHFFLLSLLPAEDEDIYFINEKRKWLRCSYGQLAEALEGTFKDTPRPKFDDFVLTLINKFIDHIKNLQALADKYTDGTYIYTLNEYFESGLKSYLPIRLPYCAISRLMYDKLEHSTLKELYNKKNDTTVFDSYISASNLGGMIGMEYDCEQKFKRNKERPKERKKIKSKGYVMQLQGEWLCIGIYSQHKEKNAPKAQRKTTRKEFYDKETTLRSILEAELEKVDFEKDYKVNFQDSDGMHGFTSKVYNLVKLKTANVSHIPLPQIADLLLKIAEIFKESAHKYKETKAAKKRINQSKEINNINQL